MEKHGIHLLALSHVYLVPCLKHRCTKALAEQLTIENVIDMIQLARLCDAPHLYLKCMKFLRSNFSKVEKTEGWKFLQRHDPLLELEILQFTDEAELVRNITPFMIWLIVSSSIQNFDHGSHNRMLRVLNWLWYIW